MPAFAVDSTRPAARSATNAAPDEAAAAGVDPALVVHFFGTKEQLFHEVMVLPPAVADALVRDDRG